ncbi:hypothetical protein ACFWVC_05870 [Streptomyces sp. NPDC058691]|uniref:hypothetical protein n=1 Tax=Streptomyces sp. NPDC058691 TaxID=3346601 RepID=UPI00364F36CA
MTAWIMLACGCVMAAMGTSTLNGWRAAQYRQHHMAGWGAIVMGGGLALEGVPRLAGWSYRVGADLATVALALVVLGAVLQVLGRPVRAKRTANGDADAPQGQPHS